MGILLLIINPEFHLLFPCKEVLQIDKGKKEYDVITLVLLCAHIYGAKDNQLDISHLSNCGIIIKV